MSTDDVRANYNRAGIDIIEMMYTDDYLSIGGDESTDKLAAAVDIRANSRVLDIGCGLGGPAFRLVERYGCHVTGLDLVDVNIDGARQRAHDRNLTDRTDFHVGNATSLAFADESFDVVWGLDAWCHVDNKDALIGESNRVLKPGGSVAFTDWLITGSLNDNDLAAVLQASASPDMATQTQYREIFERHELDLRSYEDISDVFVDQYRAVMSRLTALEKVLTERFSPKVFAIIKEKNGAILNGFESGGIGGGRFVCTKIDSGLMR